MECKKVSMVHGSRYGQGQKSLEKNTVHTVFTKIKHSNERGMKSISVNDKGEDFLPNNRML